jgi:hypothetical protein
MSKKSIFERTHGIVVASTYPHWLGFNHGFSIHRGVLVLWDEDYDRRILTMLGKMSSNVLRKLIACHEHEGSVGFIWKGRTPKQYEPGKMITVCGDEWNIYDDNP